MRVLVVKDGPLSDENVLYESDSARLIRLVTAWIQADKVIQETQFRRMLITLYPSSDSVKT